MISDVFRVFPVHIGKYVWDNHEKLKETLDIDSFPREELSSNFTDSRLRHYYNQAGKNFLKDNRKLLLDFEDFLLESVAHYAETIYGQKPSGWVVTDCWVNITDAGGSQVQHFHSNSLYSGTYFLNYDPRIHGALTFVNPFKTVVTRPSLDLAPVEVNKPGSAQSVSIPYKEGDLLIWPSQINHFTKACSGDNRISISMNFMPSELNSNNVYSWRIVVDS